MMAGLGGSGRRDSTNRYLGTYMYLMYLMYRMYLTYLACTEESEVCMIQ